MSSMALYRDFRLRRSALPRPTSASAGVPQSIVRQILEVIEGRRQARAEQEAGRFIAAHGGRLTDDVERQLMEHLGGHGFLRDVPPRGSRPFGY